jgi:hypothetical protein
MKFILFVEGHTEQKVLPQFLKRWLDPRLNAPVSIKSVKMDGWPEYMKDISKKARMHLQGPDSNDIIGAVGLLDLYGPTIFPPHLTTPEERLIWLTDDIQGKVNHTGFRQFFAVHELEAWLLADPTLFPVEVARSLPPAAVARPETVNSNRPPAKLLGQLYEEKAHAVYKKVTNGSVLFPKLDPEKVYNACPNFKAMVDGMLSLAKVAGL